MRAISPFCAKREGTTTRGDLAVFVEGIMNKHAKLGNVTAIVTDCEKSMAKAGRLLKQNKITAQVGCAAHSLQSSAGKGVHRRRGDRNAGEITQSGRGVNDAKPGDGPSSPVLHQGPCQTQAGAAGRGD